MLEHWIWFSYIPERFYREKQLLLQRFHDPEELYYCDGKAIPTLPPQLTEYLDNKDLTQARAVLTQCEKKNIGILTFRDASYPTKLRNITDPPVVLYYKGRLPDWENVPVIGVVGTRKASAYGLQNARRFAGEIAADGGLIVSGAASGIDAAAMMGALSQSRPVVGVLGCGVDRIYPASNRELFAETEKSGCLISEYAPGVPPNSWNFPRRNRIISGMSDAVLVVEAPLKSGALITARDAAEQGREVFTVPGNIDSDTCAGSNALLQDRAIPVFSGWDVLREYADLYPGKVKKTSVVFSEEPLPEPAAIPPKRERSDKKSVDKPKISEYSDRERPKPVLSPQEQQIYDCLTAEPQQVDAVIAKSGLPTATVLTILTKLSIKGVTDNLPGRRVSLK